MVIILIIHIVKNNEAIDDILNIYKVGIEDIRTNNLHITDFYNLNPGIKLKVPFLSEEVEQVLAYSESFVSDYYPQIEDIKMSDVTYDNKVVEAREMPKNENIVNEVKENGVVNKETLNPPLRAYPGAMPPKYKYGGNERK